jgi:hypothetical protein
MTDRLTVDQITKAKSRDEQRFLDKIAVDQETGCWLWTAFKDPGGYGRFHLDGRPQLAHRVAFAWWGPGIDVGLDCCHSCDTPACVNPAHLWAGTHLENERDKVNKGRQYNANKEKCPAGHLYTEENTQVTRHKDGGLNRHCLTCQRAAYRRYNAKRSGRRRAA